MVIETRNYCKARREYRNLFCKKKKAFHDGLLNEHINSVKNQQEFGQKCTKFRIKENNLQTALILLVDGFNTLRMSQKRTQMSQKRTQR